MKNEKIFLERLNGHSGKEVPFWFMRQAGRYLPEYRELRSKAKDFLHFCYSPDMATEATLQPIRRFGMSAAIIFSDILVIPDALGMDVRFEVGKGPLLSAIGSLEALAKLNLDSMDEKLAPVYQALRQTRAALPGETTLIGFCGAPWTLACYMVEGKGSRDFQHVRSTAHREPLFFASLMEMLTKAVIHHARKQIDAGAEVIQLFDSWAGCLSAEEFNRFVIAPTKVITAALKQSHPQVPVIGFPRLAGPRYSLYAEQTGVDAISVDYTIDPQWIKAQLQPKILVQGNLDPLLLAEDKEAMLKQAGYILDTLKGDRFIFNLGHGVLPHTPVENVEALCDLIKAG